MQTGLLTQTSGPCRCAFQATFALATYQSKGMQISFNFYGVRNAIQNEVW